MKRDSIAIPIAIIVAAGLIAGAIYFNGTKQQPVTQDPITNGKTATLRKVDTTDHIRGNPNAPIMLVEYSDFECPYCKIFHETLQRIMSEYAQGGKVAWVYRQLPIPQLHPNAPKIAEASECVVELGGDFWKFADSIFGGREIKESTNMSKLPEYALAAGVTPDKKVAFETCISSGKYTKKVSDSISEFIAVTGGKVGTPHTFVVVGDQSYPIEGAQPYDVVKGIIGNLVTQMEGGKVQAAPTTPAQ